jgi:hypothetical protein
MVRGILARLESIIMEVKAAEMGELGQVMGAVGRKVAVRHTRDATLAFMFAGWFVTP